MAIEESESKFFTKSSTSGKRSSRRRHRPRSFVGKVATTFHTDKKTVRKSFFAIAAAVLILAGAAYLKVHHNIEEVDYFEEEESTLVTLINFVAKNARSIQYDSRDVDREINGLNTGVNMSKYRKIYSSLSDSQRNTIKKILSH